MDVVLQGVFNRVPPPSMTNLSGNPLEGIRGALVSILLALLLFHPVGAEESYIAVDSYTGKVLLELDSERPQDMGGLAKIATAMVVLDWARLSKTSMAEMAVVPMAAAALGGANPMRLLPGDRISLREAMYSMLLGADDIAALALADHAGRSIQARSGGTSPVGAFVSEMNALARGLGMGRTRFSSPTGTMTSGRRDQTTARDLARLVIYAMRNTGFQFYVKQRERTIGSFRGNARRAFKLSNTHTMVGKGTVNGVMNGGPAGTGYGVATSSEKKAKVTKLANGATQVLPQRLITISLGNPNPWNITRSLIDQGWPVYQAWRQQGSPVTNSRELIKVPTPR